MKYFLLSLSVFLITSIAGIAENHSYPLINYTTKDYGRDFHPSNSAIAQDKRGIIYIANAFKLLEFDGHTWNSYPINKESWILSIAIDNSGIIYVGSQKEFGYFIPDSRGKLTYRSLSDSLNQADTDFKNIWKVNIFSGGVAFQSEEKLFVFRNAKIEVIKPTTSFHTSFSVNNVLYVRQRGVGLMEWKGNGLVRIKGSEIFDTTGVFMMVPFARYSKKILIGTREKGFLIFEPENKLNPFYQFKVENLSLFQNAKISGGVVTPDGSFAISTMANGLIVIDTSGKTKAVINKKYGLEDNDVKQVILDQNNNLWLALNSGISKIDISSPLSYFAEKAGISENVNVLIRHKNILFAGTSGGLFSEQRINYSDIQFFPAFNLSYPVRCLTEAGEKLLIGTDAGLYQLSNGNLEQISNEESYALFYSPDNKLLLSGGKNGLSVFRNEIRFKKLNLTDVIKDDIIGITGSTQEGVDSSEYWLGTRYNGVIRLKVYKNMTSVADHFSSADGLPDGPVTPYTFNSKMVFATSRGLFGFTNENIVKESLPDSLKKNRDFLKGYFSNLSLAGEINRKSVSSLVENGNKIWICADNKAGYLDKKNNQNLITQPFLGIDVAKINTIYPEENGVCWFGTTDGLIRYDEKIARNYNASFNCLVRKVSLIRNDSSLFLGSISVRVNNSKGSNTRTKNKGPVLEYKNNSVRLEFAAPYFESTDKIYYSYLLEGDYSGWTQWKQENYQEYTNLHEGNYTFRVKARNVYGVESSDSQYSFTVLPPWYRSPSAYVFYIFSSVFLIWLIARLYSYRLKRENMILEGIVKERTSEVVRQKDEIENKNIVLENQKKEIEDSIRYARRIQSAVIPSEKDYLGLLPESFVFFKPLNIVSGDFYWISRVDNKIIFTAADCTGHGVPGAIMSMLGVAFLNEIVNKDRITEPDAILNNLRNKIIQALQQQGISGETRDGMDIALVSIDLTDKKLKFAGAYNPLIMIRNGELFETIGDKMPIGIYEKMTPFTPNEIIIEKGDVFYMFSDGYEDQFGGPEGKKFKAKNFKQLLLEIHKHPMKIQKEIIEKSFEEWKGNLNQIDDIVVIGIGL
jgi:serine phosphatase RsbU (regulator of sigma subunit)/ligand-binding sensor domain-containing protein